MKTYKLHPELQNILHSVDISYAQCPCCEDPIHRGFSTFNCSGSPATYGHITIPMLSYKTVYIADITSPTGYIEEEYLAIVSTVQYGYDINIDYYNETTSIYDESGAKIKLNYALPFREITLETLQMLFLFS